MMTLGWTLFTRNVSKSIVENGLILVNLLTCFNRESNVKTLMLHSVLSNLGASSTLCVMIDSKIILQMISVLLLDITCIF